MKLLPQISDAELEVMKIVWKYSPINTNEITEKLMLTTQWNPKTIHTLIKRLVTKGALTYKKQGRIFVYTALINETDYIHHASHSFLNRFYDGDFTAMFSSFISDNRLSENEIDTLRLILENIKRK